ncbi:hypothetical protein VTK26DRAFT_4598 [Humicola hyalothermophila]
MEHHILRDHATSNVLAWTAANAANVETSVEEEAGADADEPPDCLLPIAPISTSFQRSPIRRPSEQHESLLTRALQSCSDEDTNESGSLRRPSRRRSIASTTSVASTADLTCPTGITTPARTSSPSPRIPQVGFAPLVAPVAGDKPKDPAVQALEKKRCISFACAAKPQPTDEGRPSAPPSQLTGNGGRVLEQAKKTSIKFACAPQPPRAGEAQQRITRPRTPVPKLSPSTPKGPADLDKPQSVSTVRAPRSPTSRRTSGSPIAIRNKKWLTADSNDLQSEGARFHEFATDEPQEDDWIRKDSLSSKPKITIGDTLKKEYEIRKLGKEAEEEADLEEEEIDEEIDEDVDEEALIDDEDEDLDAEDGDDLNDDAEDDDDEGWGEMDGDATSEHEWNDEASDGYKTDNEVGFAESEEEDDDLVLWTTRIGHLPLSGAVVMSRKLSLGEHSDSSTSSNGEPGHSHKKKRSKSRSVPARPPTPELPDSTDFVCGTLDEDKPLEEAYISCVEARKRGRHKLIPQDIDPSFPTSEPEDEADDRYGIRYGDSEDHVWLHGELEDLHHERDRLGRKKGTGSSPRRYHSPPPKRRASPATKARGHSPRKPLDRRSPRCRSPAPTRMVSRSPTTSAALGNAGVTFKLPTVQPGLTQTKSLPRATGIFAHLKARRPRSGSGTDQEPTHARGAIDIVKGLEKKRQRRREKFYQKYYNRARKEKAHPRQRPPPGQGAERMREIGLLMAGKVRPGNYVLSI